VAVAGLAATVACGIQETSALEWLELSSVDARFQLRGEHPAPLNLDAAIGDTTNTAARLEGMTKGTPYQLFVAEATRDRLQAAPGELEFVSELEVRGREQGIRVWGLRESPAPARAELPG
jgi:class 3 adenylate cyclase